MSGETTNTLINGMQKRVYDKSGIKDLRPSCAILQKKITFENGTRKIGESYQVPVALKLPNGWTPLGSTGAANGSLKQPRPQEIKQAAITPFSSILEERVVYAALSRAAQEGEGAFASLTAETLKGMKKSGGVRIEQNMLGGQKTLGTVEAVADGGSSTAVITFTAASWRPGLWWALGQGATLDSWTAGTKNNGAGVLVLTAINAAERKITVSHTATYSDEIDPGDEIYFEAATTDPTDSAVWAEAAGLIAQASNTSGTSMGLSAATYALWAGNTYNVGGNISMDNVEEAVGQLRDRGADGTLELYISNKGFAALMSQAKTNRNFDASYNSEKAKQGHKSQSYFSADVGEIEIINHPFVAQGEFLLFNPQDCCRVGSSDMDFGVPNTDADWWTPMPGTNYASIQMHVDQGTLLKKPNMGMHGYGITYT